MAISPIRWLPILLALMATGCATVTSPENRIAKNPGLYDDLSEKHQDLVREGKVVEGMSNDAVFLAWGRPDELRQGSREGRSLETWVYYGTESVPVQTMGIGIGYGYGYGRCGPGSIYDYGYGYDVAYRDYVAATVEFERGKVVSWQRNRR
ncbi:MAG: hypothetical protein KDM64_03050 [Verrucomicrobiae bacterium]|nr:hypothetical protein [Verrucomicrobiae bacterium]